MRPDGEITPEQFADAFRRVSEWAHIESREERSPFKARLTEHFGEDPATYPVTGEAVATYDLPNLQLALDAYLDRSGTEHRLIGFGGHVGYAEMSLSGLVHDFGFGLAVGPFRRTVVELERGRSVTCITTGLFLIAEGERRLAALVMQGQHGFDEAGLRLHGPPGTGKTLSTTYLISRLEGTTVVILTGAALGLVADACAIARDLQPAMVVLEDVDLVAQERTAMGFGATSLLFRLLNEMDGIGEDADVIFVITTNRADLLEPALAARPGRVDQAVEFPLPDADARSRLLDLFGRGLELSLSDREAIVAETDGVSPAFLRELARKAALHAARAGSSRVEDRHFREALDLLERGGSITRAMLGANGGAVERLDPEGEWDEDEDE